MDKTKITIPVPAALKEVSGAGNEPVQKTIIPLSGKLITAEDPLVVGKNFRTLTNMRYTDAAPKSIGGMTKINTTPLSSYLEVRNAHHFRKIQPAESTVIETHILAQAYNAGLTASQVIQNTGATPAQNNFSATELWTDSSGASVGRFSEAPGGNIAYCNGVDTCIWGGNGIPCSRILNFDSAKTFQYDYTELFSEARPSGGATIESDPGDGGKDIDNALLLHFDTSGITDSGPSEHTVTYSMVQKSTAPNTFKWENGLWFYDGNSYLQVADHADFDFSGGEWTFEAWLKVFDNAYVTAADYTLFYQKTDVYSVNYASGSREFVVGEVIHANTGDGTGIVDNYTLASGTWGGGDAAGVLYMHTVTGTWEATIILDSGSNDIADAGGAQSDAGDNYIRISYADSGFNASPLIKLVVHECYGAGSDVIDLSWAAPISTSAMSHIELSEDGDSFRFFLDGTLVSAETETSRARDYISVVWIGNDPDGNNFHSGYMDELRISKVCRHTASFTVQGAPYSGIGGGAKDVSTSMLLHLDNNVTDSGPTGHTVTNVASAVTFSDDPPSAGPKWGYAAFFNGTSGYLTVPDHTAFDLSGGQWTVDFWAEAYAASYHPFYYQEKPVTKVIFSSGSVEPSVGDTVHQAGATGIVRQVTVTGGSWAGTDAAGTIWLDSVTGTWADATAMLNAGDVDIATCDTCTTDKNYFKIEVTTDGSQVDTAAVTIRYHGADTTPVSAGGLHIVYGEEYWHHLQFSEAGDTWYIFIDGSLVATGTNAIRPENYSTVVYIGEDPYNSRFYWGYLDEFRVSKICRTISSFAVPTAAYTETSGAGGIGKLYLMTPRPAQGFKFYVKTANTTTATVSGNVWTGQAFEELTLTDGTAITGKTLAQTGSITFSSTVSTAKLKYLEGTLAYCYEFTFSGIDASAELYHITADCPFQLITDLWDGIDRSIAKFYLFKTAPEDYTLNVREDRYDSADAATYAELDSLTSSQYVEIGFFERMTAINLALVPGHVNATANTLATVYYWNGEEYVSAGTVVDDGTKVGTVSLAQPGIISWNAPPETSEQKKSISNGVPMYYYKIVWSQTLSADVQISYVSGLPAQKSIKGYKFPIYSQDCLMLCGNMNGKRNSIRVSAPDSAQVFNGQSSWDFEFGDQEELNAGCTVFSQYGSNLFNITMLFKDKEIWNLVWNGTTWIKYRVSESVGCAAGLTLDTVIIPPIEGQQQANRCLSIWATYNGVYISEGRHPVDVSHDIRDLFDQNSETHINLSYMKSFSGKVDRARLEYHLFIAVTTGTVTTLDDEWVLDLRRWRWFHVDRGTGKRIQCAINVTDAYGANHSYGFLNTGYMERLEYGTTFDGEDIVSTWQLGDFSLADGDYLTENQIKALVPVLKAKTTTEADATFTLYTDTSATGTDYTIDPTSASHRLTFPVKTENSVPGVLHSLKMVMTTDDEVCGLEPFLVALYYQKIREHDYE